MSFSLFFTETDACTIVFLDFHRIFAPTQSHDAIYSKTAGLFKYVRPCSGHRRTILSVLDYFIGLAQKGLNSIQSH